MNRKSKAISGKPTRDFIIEEADRLFYHQGYEHTSFSDIAASVDISRGNFYYHFKSKDEILQAVIAYRLDGIQDMLQEWEKKWTEPMDRILAFVDILIVNKNLIKSYGCPVGMLCTELGRLDHHLKGEANALFSLFRKWLRNEFVLLGHKRDADTLALHLIARSQGVATMASVFHDEKFIKKEVKDLRDWVISHES